MLIRPSDLPEPERLMKPSPRVWTLTFLPLAVVILSEPAQGQDTCPRASGPDAEAG
jgi:hypothetical protein